MIGFFNAIDSSFFEVTSTDLTSKKLTILTKDIVSFSLTEENRRIINGSISLNDPNHTLSRILRPGMNLNISWGYTKIKNPLFLALMLKLNQKELISTGAAKRENIKCVVQNPQTTLTESRIVNFNCNFYGSEIFYNEKITAIYQIGTKGTVVATVLAKMGIMTSTINFSKMIDPVTINRPIYQREGNFKFLNRLAKKWNCAFRIGYTKLGISYAVFVDYSQIGDILSTLALSGAMSGDTIHLDWGDGLRNVISATISNKGFGTTGDQVTIKYSPTGDPIFERRIATTDSVTTWRINTARIKKDLVGLSLTERTAKMSEFLKVQDFESVKKYFDPVIEETAPQGLGYEIDVKMKGNPYLSVPIKVEFGEGFPDYISNKNSKYYTNKVTHKIDRSGYLCTAKIADSLIGGLAL